MHHYKGTINLLPSHHFIKADLYLTYVFNEENKDHLKFYLHKNLKIESIEGEGVRDYHVSDEIDNWCPFILESKPITIKLNRPYYKGDKITIHFVYEGKIEIVSKWTMNRITSEFVELGIYTPYYPLTPTFDKAAFHFKVDLPDDYELLDAIKIRDKWHIETNEPTNDCTLVASNRFKKYETPFDLAIYYIDDASQQVSKNIQMMSQKIMNFYNDVFSRRVTENKLSLVILPRKYGGAYVRPTIMVFSEINDQKDISIRYLAHELGHLWWNKAFSNSWEDWLNESFAEYSALMVIRQLKGQNAFNQMLEEYREDSKNTPPIYKINRGDNSSTTVLYKKGPLVLHQLENTIGKERFLDLLKQVHINHIKTTNELLELITSLEGKDISEMLLNELMK